MAATYNVTLESVEPLVQQSGLNTNEPVDFSGAATVALPTDTTVGGSAIAGLGNITSSVTTGASFSVTNTGVYTGVGAVQTVGNSATTGVVQLITANGLTTGTALSVTSTGTITTTGEVVNIAGNTATTSTGLLRVSGTGLTDGFAAEFTSGGANLTATGGGINVAMGAATAGTGIQITTTGVYTGTTGALAITADSATTGVLAKISGNGLTTGTGLLITSSGTLATTGNLLTLTGNSATTAAGLLRINGNALTDGKGLIIASSSTVLSSTGRLLHVSHTGNAGVSAVLAEVSSAAADETVVFQALASAALAAGKVVNVSGAAVTTGTLLSVSNADALTTGLVAEFKSNSADATARTLVSIHNDNTAATGSIPLKITQDAVTSTNFKLMATFGTIQLFISDQTSPNTALTATEGSICLNGSATGQAYWNNDGATSWVALA